MSTKLLESRCKQNLSLSHVNLSYTHTHSYILFLFSLQTVSPDPRTTCGPYHNVSNSSSYFHVKELEGHNHDTIGK